MERSPYTLEWEARGAARARRESLLTILEARLGAPLPPDVVDAVEKQTDDAALKHWFTQAIRVSTLAEARALLGLPHPG